MRYEPLLGAANKIETRRLLLPSLPILSRKLMVYCIAIARRARCRDRCGQPEEKKRSDDVFSGTIKTMGKLTLYSRSIDLKGLLLLVPATKKKSPPTRHLRWHPLRGEWVAAYASHRQRTLCLQPPVQSLAPTTDAHFQPNFLKTL